MKLWTNISEGLRTLFHKKSIEDDMAEEMRFHMEMQELAFLEMGMSAEEARVATLRQFGHVERIKETARDERTWVWLEQIFVDMGHAARSLRQSRGFFLVTVLTLALGIGFCTTTFSLVNPLLFKPLSFPESERLVFLDQSNFGQGLESMMLAYSDYADWREQNHVFTDLGLYDLTTFTLGEGDHLTRVMGGHITAGLFDILGVKPMLGRGFEESHEVEGLDNVCVISHGFWQKHFAAKTSALGQWLTIDGRQLMVIGVMPESFAFQDSARLWIPLCKQTAETTRGAHHYLGIARLKPGVSLNQSVAELTMICERLARQHPLLCGGVLPRIVPLRDEFLDSRYRTICWSVIGAVAFVLAVACSNAANLFLARAFARRKEFAIRAALGAGRWRTIQRLMCESLVIALCAGTLGLLLSFWGVPLVLSLVPESIPHWISFSLDWRTCAFTVLVSLGTCVLFGLVPAWWMAQENIQDGLNESGRGSRESRKHSRLRSALVFSEVVLATVLLCGTGLLIKTVRQLQNTDPGFDANRLHLIDVSAPLDGQAAAEKNVTFFRNLVSEISTLPGIVAAASTSAVIGGGTSGQMFHVEGTPVPPSGFLPVAQLRVCSPGYFRLMGVSLLRGRDFTAADGDKSGFVTIIDASLARQYFAGQDPIGKHIRWGTTNVAPVFEVIGVVGDVRYFGLDRESPPGFYVPHLTVSYPRLSILIRTEGREVPGLGEGIRQAMRHVDPRLSVPTPVLMEDLIEQSYWKKRLLMQVLGAFSIFALILSSVGIAGMVAYSVLQRTHEIGVRIALGAAPSTVLTFIMKQGMGLVLGGLIVGLLLSIVMSRVLSANLFGASLIDPVTLAVCAALFTAVSALSCYAPARKVTRMNPMTALRAE